MAKTSLHFNAGEYALVASRITLFYERYPTGRIITELISRDRDVVFKASVFRSSADEQPAATGWASEREGDGEINEVACVENTETSAIGRALANLGFTASLKRPSREEMEKAERARSRLYRASEKKEASLHVSENSDSARGRDTGPSVAQRKSDVMELVLEAGSRGMPASFMGRFEQRIIDNDLTTEDLVEIERRARFWLLRRAGPSTRKDQSDTALPHQSVNSPHQ